MARTMIGTTLVGAVVLTASVFTQINFPKDGYFVGMGDSIAAGEGALPATNGYVYNLYERGVFGRPKTIEFANVAVRGARSWDLRDHQVPQVLCSASATRPTVVTITAGANDFFRGDLNIPGIAQRVSDAVNLLLNNDSATVPVPIPVLDPVTGQRCQALSDVTILVSNYYSIPHPDTAVFLQLEAAIQGFDQALRAFLQALPVPAGSRLAVVDLYTPSLGRRGLVTIDRRFGFSGPADFDPHPTNLGHSFIAKQFEEAWQRLQ